MSSGLPIIGRFFYVPTFSYTCNIQYIVDIMETMDVYSVYISIPHCRTYTVQIG